MPTKKPICMKFEVDDFEINQRVSDGYINATEMCDVCSKDFADYTEIRFTKRFLRELSHEIHVDKSDLIQNDDNNEDMWVHPRVAINLAQWVSPKLAVLVPMWVFQWLLQKQLPKKEEPYNKFENYDPEFGSLIDKALSYTPRRRRVSKE